MGIRCSLLGHDYGESFVERDREERGNEVVVTERELRECNRCGAEHVTSENTEVRPIQPSSESEAEAEPDAGVDADAQTADQGTPATDEGSDAGGAFTSTTEVIEQAEAGTSDATEAGATADADAGGGDDAVIIDDDADDETPGSDQWDEPADPEVDPDDPGTPTPDPDEEDVEFVESGPADAAGADPAEPEPDAAPAAEPGTDTDTGGEVFDGEREDRSRGEWPEPDGEDEGFDATPGGEDEGFDATPGGEDPAGDAEVAAPDAAGGDADTGTFEFGAASEPDPAEETGFTSAGPVDQAGADDLDFTLFCPECGFERYAAGSSLRAGDICPECKRGYLGEDR